MNCVISVELKILFTLLALEYYYLNRNCHQNFYIRNESVKYGNGLRGLERKVALAGK